MVYLPARKKLNLQASENTLFIRFKPSVLIQSEKLRYRYRLRPDAEWNEFFNEPVLELPYLPWGKYQLEIEAWDYHSGEMNRINLLDFEIARPYYLQIWFLIFGSFDSRGNFCGSLPNSKKTISSESSIKPKAYRNQAGSSAIADEPPLYLQCDQ